MFSLKCQTELQDIVCVLIHTKYISIFCDSCKKKSQEKELISGFNQKKQSNN